MKFPEYPVMIDGYPIEQFITWIEECDVLEWGLMNYLEVILDEWYHGDYGWRIKRKYKGKTTVYISTLGWSGNEEMLYAMQRNSLFWSVVFYNHRTGGHYTLKVPDFNK